MLVSFINANYAFHTSFYGDDDDDYNIIIYFQHKKFRTVITSSDSLIWAQIMNGEGKKSLSIKYHCHTIKSFDWWAPFSFHPDPPFFPTSNCTIYEIYSPNNEWRRVLSHMLLGCHSKCDICWVVPIHTLCLWGSGRMLLCYKPWKWNKTHCFDTNITKHE